jgi:EAL domain-containing protein (putative c-di-GMP-specific phosphodiesterase class I)
VLTLEITETAAVEDSAMADQVLAALDEAGVAISIDDFGTGHSSLARIARFPICEIKIDRSFVRDMHDAKLPIVPTTIELAHALGLRVVAEGIEDAATFEALQELGCDIAQGYHLSRPLCDSDFTTWLELSNRALIGVTHLSEEREPCSRSQDSQSGSVASRRSTTLASPSATAASAG